ncbi:peptidoglycan-binding protein [Albidovulum sediminicola]|uniref:Peptidoglycan-binding protein n=1 Tax=Albidovulum sediminicola TaxID=2984331 RepID=A0ABT2Z6J9_9RHOB|nr:peptidoglycan-binding protein [Defluviimonas sp. WL0075]MCV2866705.1 peptidoglycan-binding protein [Defluviimonas sp. WL0075]
MAIRPVVLASMIAITPLPALGQNLDPGDIFNLGNQIVNGLQKPQTSPPQQIPSPSQVPAYDASQVYEAQTLLARLGYDPGPADGVMGSRTSNAIRQFETAQGLPPTGQPSPALISRLRSVSGSSATANLGTATPTPGGQAITPSFDCGRATTEVEMAICRTPELAQLDRVLSDTYSAQRNSASAIRAPALAAEQRAWLAQRDRCGRDVNCLSRMMTNRIAQLGGGTTVADGTSMAPQASSPATSGSASAASTPKLAAEIQTVDGRPVIFNYYTGQEKEVWKLFELVGMIPDDPRFSGGNLPLWAGDLLGTDELRAIAAQAQNGALSTRVDTFLSTPRKPSGISTSEFISLQLLENDFERQRFETLLRQRLAGALPGMRPQTPVPVRFYCLLELKPNPETGSPLYDFETQSFEMANFKKTCATGNEAMSGRLPRAALGTINRGRFQPKIETEAYPARILLAPEQAEDFVNVMARHRMVIGFDAELDAHSGRTKANDSAPEGEAVSLYSIRRTGPYKLYYESQPERAIYEFPSDQLKPKPLTEEEKRASKLADMDRVWYFDNTDEHQALLDLAQPAGSYSTDLFAGSGILTFGTSPAIESGGWERVTSPDPTIGLNDGFDTRSSRRIAQSLGRPQSSVFAARINLAGLGGSPISQVYVALPDVLESYKRPAPDAGGKFSLWVNFRMKQAWRLEEQGNKPAILIFAEPVSGAYYQQDLPYGAPAVPVSEFRFEGNGPVDFERFALARPRDIIAAVAEATGDDRVELIGSLYPPSSQDSFARQDEIEMLASTAKAIDLGGFWMTGNGRYAEYDFATQTFGFDYLNLAYSAMLSRNEGGIQREQLFRLTNVGDNGIRFAMAEDEARRLQQAAGGADAIYRALIVAEPPNGKSGVASLPMSARVAEIVVLQAGSDPQVEVAANVLARIDLAPAGNAAAAGRPDAQAAAAPGGYDLLDIRIRQEFGAVLPGIEESFRPETVLYGRRDVWKDQQNLPNIVTPTMPLAESIILVRNGGTDSLTIFHEPLLPEDPVTGIARTLSFAEGARPSPDAVKALLVKKYGDFALQQGVAFDWFRAVPVPEAAPDGELTTGELIQIETDRQMAQSNAFKCSQLLSSAAMQLDHEAQSLNRTNYPGFADKTYPVVGPDNTQAALPGSNPLWPISYFDTSYAECGEDLVLAVMEPDSNGLVSALRVLVTNRGYLAEIEARAKAALISDNTIADEAMPEIKL